MKSADGVGITFANHVMGVGFQNGVLNVTLGASLFTPTEDGKVDADPAIVSRLRMDEPCAIALRDSLSKMLNNVADARVKAQVDAHATAEAANGSDRKETMQ